MYVKFTAYGSETGLDMLGRTKAILTAPCGASHSSIVYIVKGTNQSLLGLKDATALGILKINPRGEVSDETVNQLEEMKKSLSASNDVKMAKEVVEKYPELFRGVGRAKVEPIHIEVDPSVKPVQQKQR